jgi:hypothetical protein
MNLQEPSVTILRYEYKVWRNVKRAMPMRIVLGIRALLAAANGASAAIWEWGD